MAYTGSGAAIAISSGVTFVGRWTRITNPFSKTVADLDDTALESTFFKESVPDDLADVEQIDIEFTEDYMKQLSLGVTCLLTLTFPKQPGQNGAAILSGTGYFNSHRRSDLEPGVRLKASASFKFDGKTTKPNYAPAS